MANNIVPKNPNTPPSFPSPGNVGSLTNPNTLSNLNSSKPPLTFGDQIKDQSKQQVIKTATNDPLANLYKEKTALVQEGIQLDINHQLALYKLDQQHKLYQKLSQSNTSNTNVTSETSAPPSQLTANVTKEDIYYITDDSWKKQSPDKEHGLRQCKTNYEGPCDVIWDGYIHNYVSQFLWEQKFKTSVPSIIDGNDNTDPNPKINTSTPSVGLSDEEYNIAVNTENDNYKKSQDNLAERKETNKKAIDDIVKDPFKKQKDKQKSLKKKRDKRKKKNREEKRRARKSRSQQVFKNPKKSLVPILTLTLTNQIANIIAQNDKIGKLVNDTNDVITTANESGDITKLQSAKVARDNAIKVIQDNENKIIKIRDQINRINTIINIFNVIVTIVSAIPLPTAVPPGIGIPLNLVIKFVKILDKAIAILEDYKSQLLDINNQLEKAAGSSDNFALLSGPGSLNGGTGGVGGIGGNGFGTISETYKGFRFALREDNKLKGTFVGQFQRHYAVAIDASNVEVLKSDISFTLDPDDLISQLKLLIDQQGLTTGDGLSSPNGNPNSNNNSNNSNNSSNNSNNTNQSNNPNLSSQLPSSGIPSASSISTLSKTLRKPPPPIVVVGPAGSGITAKVPLGIVEKGKLIALAAASGPDPRPKTDVAFIFAADKKWHIEDKKYKNSIKDNSNINY
jgi:hypothetical protein